MSYSNIADYTGGQRDYWSWAHLKTFIGQDEAVEHFYAGEASLGPLARTCPYIPVPCSVCKSWSGCCQHLHNAMMVICECMPKVPPRSCTQAVPQCLDWHKSQPPAICMHLQMQVGRHDYTWPCHVHPVLRTS